MSKKNFKRNSVSNRFQEDFEPSSEYVAKTFADSIEQATDEELGKAVSFKKQKENDEDYSIDVYDQEDSPRSNVVSAMITRAVSSVRNIPFRKAGSFLLSVPRLSLRGMVRAGRWSWGLLKRTGPLLRKLPSFFTFRKSEEEQWEDEEAAELAELERLEKEERLAAAKQRKDAGLPSEETFNEEEEATGGFSWAGKSIKVAAAAAVLLAVAGGGYGIKNTFFNKNKKDEVAKIESLPDPDGQHVETKDAPPTEKPDPNQANHDQARKEKPAPQPPVPEPQKAIPNPMTAKNAAKPSAEPPKQAVPAPAAAIPKEEKKPTIPVPATPKEEKKPAPPTAPKDEKKPAPAPPKDEKKPTTPVTVAPKDEKKPASPAVAAASPATPPKEEKKPVAAPPPVAATPKEEKKPTAAPAPLAAGPFAPVVQAPVPVQENVASAPAPESAPFDPFAAALAPMAADPTASPAPPVPFSGNPPAMPSMPEPTLAAAPPTPSAPPSLPAAEKTPVATPSGLNAAETKLQPIVPFSSAPSETLQPETAISRQGTLQPLVGHSTPQEQGIGIPASNTPSSTGTKFSEEGFTAAPAPRTVDVSVPKLEMDRSVIRPIASDPPPEIAPMIPTGEKVIPTTASTRPVSTGEPAPGIPVDSVQARQPSFTKPNVETTAPLQSAAVSGQSPAHAAYAPPLLIPAEPATMAMAPVTAEPMEPVAQNRFTAPVVKSEAAPPAKPVSGDSIGIPGESLPTLTASTVGAVSRAAVTETPPALAAEPVPQPEASNEPRLGSRLQSKIEELRTRETSSPRLLFQTQSNESGGARRYSPSGATENESIPSAAPLSRTELLPMPGSNDEAFGKLQQLNPTGVRSDQVSEQSLPSADQAPKSVIAPNGRRYRQSAAPREHAQVSLDSAVGVSTVQGQNASTFGARINQAISQSPEETKMYTVQPGDTYMTICDRIFGTSLLYRALAIHNRRRGVSWIPPEGTVIEIPTAEYLKTNYADELSRSGRTDGVQVRRQRSGGSVDLSSVSGVRYTVREGDSVFKIAENQLRDSTRWREIILANQDQLRDAKDLQPGMVITVPSAVAARPTSVY